MQIKQLIPLVLLPFMMFSCKEKQCDTPCESPYAPENASISWTDYNSVREFLDYFTCHPATIKEHADDTIRVTGWLYYGEPGVDAMVWDESELEYSPKIILTANQNHYGYDDIIYMRLQEDSLWMYVREHISDFSDKQIYATCILGYADMPPISGCCYRSVVLKTINITTYFDL